MVRDARLRGRYGGLLTMRSFLWALDFGAAAVNRGHHHISLPPPFSRLIAARIAGESPHADETRRIGASEWGALITQTEGHMPKRMSSFVPAGLAIVLLAIVASIAPSSGATPVAEDCLSAPNSEAPQAMHWYYRLNRTTRKQCWYLGPNDAKGRAAAARKARGSAKPVAEPTPEIDAAAPLAATPVPTVSVRAAEPPNLDGPRDSAFFMRWPDQAKPGTAAPREAPPLANNSAEEPAEVVQSAEPMETPAVEPAQAPPPRAPAMPPAVRSEQMLAALAGALALAGIVGHLLYRGATSRGRRYRDRFERWEAATPPPEARGSILPVLAAANAADALETIARQTFARHVPLAPNAAADGRERPEWCEPEERRESLELRAVHREMAYVDDAPGQGDQYGGDVQADSDESEAEPRDVEAKLQQLLQDWSRVAA